MTKRHVKVTSVKNQSRIADECIVAESFIDRLIGLLGRKVFHPGEGLLLNPCNDIHMWFMRISIDVVFVEPILSPNNTNKEQGTFYRVTSVREDVRPWRVFPLRDGKASQTLELPTGTVHRCQVRAGDELCIN